MRRNTIAALTLLAALSFSAASARAADLATLQIAIAVPDPVVAGDSINFQVLAVNIGDQAWLPNSYFWEVEIYDLDRNYITKTDRVYPGATVPAGGSAAATLRFVVPERFLGRKLYRVNLGHNEQRLIQSEMNTFQVIERPILPPPETPYKFGGNLTVSGTKSTVNGYSGAETLNLIGKMQDSSLLVNAYFLNNSTHTIDPYILLGTYYAPWGTVSAGDLSPDFNPLALQGQGMRGGMLDQNKDWGRWGANWTVLYGQASSALIGSATTDGRYARDIFGARGGVKSPYKWSLDLDYVLGSDSDGSLSADPLASNFRGPNVRPQSNPVYGALWHWTPNQDWDAKLTYQQSGHVLDTSLSTTSVTDSAERAELAFKHGIWRAKGWVQKTGKDYIAFGAPTAIPDRQTMDFAGSVVPAGWINFSAAYDNFKDNLENDPSKTTTNQTVMNLGSSIKAGPSTSFTLGVSQNTAVGNPQAALDTNTTTLSASVAQTLGPQYLSANFQSSTFKDNNGLAHDLGTTTIGLNGALKLPRSITSSLGFTTSNTADQIDGSTRKSNTISASFGVPYSAKLRFQLWGTMLSTKSDSPTAPADLTTMNANLEATWQHSAKLGYTLGLGQNNTTDNVTTANSVNETLLTVRVSYNF